MLQIDKHERDAVLNRFPKADIVRTRHRYFLIGASNCEEMRLVLTMRGITPPMSRRERAIAARHGT